MNKRTILILLMLIGAVAGSMAAETASQVVRRTAELIRRASGVSVGFVMKTEQGSMKGTLKCAGSKFVMTSGAVSTWFDGKTMWTYNPRTEETTITIPDASEIAESNPLALISANRENYTATFAKTQPKGSKVVILTPKKKGTGVKKVEVTVGATSYLPTKVVVSPSSGGTTHISLSGLSTQAKIPASSFVYPAKNYPKATLVDLR